MTLGCSRAAAQRNLTRVRLANTTLVDNRSVRSNTLYYETTGQGGAVYVECLETVEVVGSRWVRNSAAWQVGGFGVKTLQPRLIRGLLSCGHWAR